MAFYQEKVLFIVYKPMARDRGSYWTAYGGAKRGYSNLTLQ